MSKKATEEEGEEVLSTSDIKDFLKHWEAVRTVILLRHPNKVVRSRSVNIMEENVIKHFRDVLKRRQKQVSIERFLVKMQKRPSGESQGEASAAKCTKKDSETWVKSKLASSNQAQVACNPPK